MPIEDEGRAIREVVDRITDKFPGVERATVERHVEDRLAKYGGAAVRDFVPVLVEHEVAEHFRALAPRREQESRA